VANLKTKIVVRFKTADGKRCWADANGKTDPQGSSYYLRFYEGSKTKHEAVDGDYHQAELAQIRLDRKLKAASQGFVVPEEPVAEPLKVNHRIQDVIDA